MVKNTQNVDKSTEQTKMSINLKGQVNTFDVEGGSENSENTRILEKSGY